MSRKNHDSPVIGRDQELTLFLILTILNVVIKVCYTIILETIYLIKLGHITDHLWDYGLLAIAIISSIVLTIIAVKTRKVQKFSIIIALIQIFMIDTEAVSVYDQFGIGSSIWFISTILYIVILVKGRIKYLLYILTGSMAAIMHFVYCVSPDNNNSNMSTMMEFIVGFVVLFIVSAAVIIMSEIEIKLLRNTILENEKQKKEIENLNKAQNRFFSNMSHEIRTPINTIIGLNEMILRENTSEEVADDARNIQSASKMLLSLINDILDMSKMESGKMDIVKSPYDVGEMLSDIVNMVWAKANEKGLNFTVDIDPFTPAKLMSDDVRIKQILINLLNNAIKYTNEGKVTFSIHCELTDHDSAIVTYMVEDTGMGIRKESIPHLFDAFRREEEDKNKYIEGTGLGLSIVKQLTELLGGEISVDSVYTKGSIFTVTIEQQIVDSKQIGEFDPEKTYNNKKLNIYHQSFEAPEAKVLIVDDNTTNLLVASKLLRDTRVKIKTALNAKECLHFTAQEHFDVILMDHLMPGMDGIECMHAIRDQKGGLCKDSPIVVLTANAGSENQALYRKEGFDGYLLKPVSGELLEETLLSLIPADLILIRENEAAKLDSYRIVHETRSKIPLLITTDSVADIPVSILNELKIPILPYNVHMMGAVFADGLEADGDSIIRYLEEKVTNARSEAPDVADYERFFALQLSKAYHIIHITMAKNSSKGFKNASEAALSFNNVTVLDSGHLSSGMGLLAIYARELSMDSGLDISEVIRKTKLKRAKIQTSFIVESTEYLYRSGRLSEKIHKICNAFMVHPVIKLKNSAMNVAGILVGSYRHVKSSYIKKALSNPSEIDTSVLFITYVGISNSEIEEIKNEVLSIVKFEKVYLQKASPAISINCGPGTFGLLFSRK